MLKTGLLSITFRQLSPQQIVDLVVRAGLHGIEWGGDIHVPHGDQAKAQEVRAMTEAAGLEVSAYGSYFRFKREEPLPFESVLATAVELGAPVVRVWAGELGSADAGAAEWAWIVEESRRIAALAAEAGVLVAYEFHSKTLTDTAESTVRLLREVAHPSIRTFWQPPVGLSPAECLAGLELVQPWLENVHVFHWGSAGIQERKALSAGELIWKTYIDRLKAMDGKRFLSLEYVRDDSPECFLEDAAALNGLVI